MTNLHTQPTQAAQAKNGPPEDDSPNSLRWPAVTLICRGLDARAVTRVAAAAVAQRVQAIEVTVNSPDPFMTIKGLVREFGSQLRVGLGTARSIDHVTAAADAGAAFIVSPHLSEVIVNAVKQARMMCIPGAYTPTEISRAWEMGADLVKVFPIQQSGASYISQVRAPLDDIPLLVSGGLTAVEAAACFAAGAVGALVGVTFIAADAVAQEDWTAVESAICHYRATAEGHVRSQSLRIRAPGTAAEPPT